MGCLPTSSDFYIDLTFLGNVNKPNMTIRIDISKQIATNRYPSRVSEFVWTAALGPWPHHWRQASSELQRVWKGFAEDRLGGTPELFLLPHPNRIVSMRFTWFTFIKVFVFYVLGLWVLGDVPSGKGFDTHRLATQACQYNYMIVTALNGQTTFTRKPRWFWLIATVNVCQ